MIVGVVGLPCTGKDCFSEILARNGFNKLIFSDVLKDLLRKRGEEITRLKLQDLGNELRDKEGAGVLAKKLVEKMDENKDYVVQGFRNPAEIEEFRKIKDFVLIRIVSLVETRFARMKKRKFSGDPRTFEEFINLDNKELGRKQEKHGLRIRNCMSRADGEISNDGSLRDFEISVHNSLEGLFSLRKK